MLKNLSVLLECTKMYLLYKLAIAADMSATILHADDRDTPAKSATELSIVPNA